MQVSKLQQQIPLVPNVRNPVSTQGIGKDFAAFLQESLTQVNQLQNQSDKLTQQFISGELSDVHSLMIAAEKASLGLQLTVQVRNKMIEAYQEMMRMQV